MGARSLGLRSVSLDPGVDCPASQVTDRHIAAAYDDLGCGAGVGGAVGCGDL